MLRIVIWLALVAAYFYYRCHRAQKQRRSKLFDQHGDLLWQRPCCYFIKSIFRRGAKK